MELEFLPDKEVISLVMSAILILFMAIPYRPCLLFKGEVKALTMCKGQIPEGRYGSKIEMMAWSETSSPLFSTRFHLTVVGLSVSR
ncbi:MAG: hypothetical protein ICV51_12045 [Flavisolibacter sp.]|nr:hypothetical protein [Flavisolibacter sp.]MBD0376348.1 hypothetical protein [Flavisolibacter sp.]